MGDSASANWLLAHLLNGGAPPKDEPDDTPPEPDGVVCRRGDPDAAADDVDVPDDHDAEPGEIVTASGDPDDVKLCRIGDARPRSTLPESAALIETETKALLSIEALRRSARTAVANVQTDEQRRKQVDAAVATMHKAPLIRTAKFNGTIRHTAASESIEPLPVGRHFLMHGMGSGKSTSCSATIPAWRDELLSGNVVAYIPASYERADDFEAMVRADLAAAGLNVEVRNFQAIGRLCTNDALKPTVMALYDAGLSTRDKCATCSEKKGCRYLRQQAPMSGGVAIIQQARIAVGFSPEIDGDGRIVATFFDESILGALLRHFELRADHLRKSIKITPRRQAKETDAEFAKRVAECKAHSTVFNDWRKRISKLVSSGDLVWPAAVDGKRPASYIQHRLSMDDLRAHGFLQFRELTAGDVKLREGNSTDYMRLLMDVSNRFDNVEGARVRGAKNSAISQYFADLRAAASANIEAGTLDFNVELSSGDMLRLIECIVAFIEAVESNKHRNDTQSTIALRETVIARGGKSRKVRNIQWMSIAKIPQAYLDGAVAFLDGTGDPQITASAIGERFDGWKVSGGRAERPHARTIKFLGMPVGASQMLHHDDAPPWIALGAQRIVVDGQGYKRGKAVETVKQRTLDLAKRRSDSNASGVERLLMGLTHEYRGKSIGIISSKVFRTAAEGRQWSTDAGILWGHHGAVAGSNAWKDHDVLIALGDYLPPVDTLEQTALALSAADPAGPAVITTGRFKQAYEPLKGTDDVIVRIGHDDPLVDRLIRMMVAGQQEQVYERLRMSSRTADTPCTLIAIDRLGTTEFWDEVQHVEPPRVWDTFVKLTGREPVSAADAYKTCGALFATKKAAQEWWKAEMDHRRVKLGDFPQLALAAKGGIEKVDLSYKQLELIGENTGLNCKEPVKVDANNRVSNQPRSALFNVTWEVFLAAEAEVGRGRKLERRLTEIVGQTVSVKAVLRAIENAVALGLLAK